MTIFVVDAGNTFIKWASFEHDALKDTGRALRPEDKFQAFADEAWAAIPAPERVIVANVAGPSFGDELAAWTDKTWQRRPEFVVAQRAACGVRNAYLEPHKLGVDRWAAMIAAHRLAQGAVCVISCGTAITLDVLTGNGEHQGGLIVPGLAMMRRALLEGTQGIAQNLTASGTVEQPTLLARDTQGGVQGGTLYATVAVIDRVVADVSAELRTAMTCVITGGDAPTLLPLLAGRCHHEPELVLQGLAIIAGKNAERT
ncbi:MAG: type III pantothenate kinase [Gammaproteobacteria bacterium]|nr:type III pantothenate kinase [Gammaproteobacteria bacterium]